ncbi:protein NinF [Klebsiella quasipneumoniae]|uniref:protein NinF n=1 Tax=Klebsiella quasipneumoniae TaxID=1463165 RepID=UPI003450D8EE
MLSPEQISQYHAECNRRAGVCLECGIRLVEQECHVCDRCATNLYPDQNQEEEQEDG